MTDALDVDGLRIGRWCRLPVAPQALSLEGDFGVRMLRDLVKDVPVSGPNDPGHLCSPAR